MINQLLINPNDPNYSLSESEIYLIKEAKELIEINHYIYALQALYNCIISNLHRRIEYFGIDIFLNVINSDEKYNKDGNKLEDRWLNVSKYSTISYAKKLNIIDNSTHDIISSIYWKKSNTNEEDNKNITQEEIYALFYLVEKNLFLKPFKMDQRDKNSSESTNNQNRRKSDKTSEIFDINRQHQELLYHTKDVYEKQKTKEEINPYLDKYV